MYKVFFLKKNFYGTLAKSGRFQLLHTWRGDTYSVANFVLKMQNGFFYFFYFWFKYQKHNSHLFDLCIGLSYVATPTRLYQIHSPNNGGECFLSSPRNPLQTLVNKPSHTFLSTYSHSQTGKTRRTRFSSQIRTSIFYI